MGYHNGIVIGSAENLSPFTGLLVGEIEQFSGDHCQQIDDQIWNLQCKCAISQSSDHVLRHMPVKRQFCQMLWSLEPLRILPSRN